MVNLTMQHVTALKQVLRYLSGTKSYGITYSNILDHPNHFLRYTTTFANMDNHKSTTGYTFKMAGGMVTWYSQKQSVIALSSIEAEYIALSEVAQEVCWLRSLFCKLRFAQVLPTKILGDNEGSIALAKNP